MAKVTVFSPTFLLFLLLLVSTAKVEAYDIQNRWVNTQVNGSGIERGDPTTLIWSIVPDGNSYERSSNSQLIDYLDDGWNVSEVDRTPTFNNRVWWDVIKSAYDQYEGVSGLRMIYRPEQNASGADTGIRGDIRIGGEIIDNDPGGVLADNTFAGSGDMRIDTSRDANGNPSGSHTSVAGFRNLISHESGHGVGITHSVGIIGAESVMEPFIQTHFFGLQFDDVYAFNRNYGDPYEKGSNNDVSSTGTSLGTFSPAVGASASSSSISLGTDANDSVVEELDHDWLGIDGSSDEDWFRFSVTERGIVDLKVTPQGPTYTTDKQGFFNAAAQSNLQFELYSPNMTLIKAENKTSLGQPEKISSLFLEEVGEYYVRVSGTEDLNQFYQIDLDVTYSELMLTIDRTSGEATLSSFAAGGVDFDGYAIQSSLNELNPSDGNWNSLQDQGQAGWSESNPTSSALAELLSSGIKHLAEGETVSLGTIYSPAITAPFGTVQEDSLTFEYYSPEGESTPIVGAIQYTGSPLFNNLVLTVDPETGDAILTNESNTTISLDGYVISSDSDSLTPESWLSLDEQDVLDWRESNPTEGSLVELKPTDGMMLAPMAVYNLGQLFDSEGAQDLLLTFLLEGEDSFWDGIVEYVSLAVAGDYDSDGDVDADDYAVWVSSYGSTTNLAADGNEDGVVDAADYTVWRDNLSTTSFSVTSVPEPSSAILICLAGLAFSCRTRKFCV